VRGPVVIERTTESNTEQAQAGNSEALHAQQLQSALPATAERPGQTFFEIAQLND
jgi:hypothetical protein